MTSRFVRQPHVVAAEQGDRTVLLDVARGRYYTLNEVGGRAWQLLHAGATLEQLVAALASEYEVTPERVRPDLGSLLEQLRLAGLVTLDDAPAGEATVP